MSNINDTNPKLGKKNEKNNETQYSKEEKILKLESPNQISTESNTIDKKIDENKIFSSHFISIGKIKFYYKMTLKLLFIISFFCISLYLLIKNLKNTNISLVITQTKIIYYLLIALFFYFISDLLKEDFNCKNKLIYIIIFTFIISYTSLYCIEYYFKGTDVIKYSIISGTIIGIVIFLLLLIYFYIGYDDKISNAVNNVFNNNYKYYLFFLIILIVYTLVFNAYNNNSSINQIRQPILLGIFLIIIIFSFIINICLKLDIINKNQYLDTFIVLMSFLILFGYFYFYMFLDSFSTICVNKQ